MDKNPNEQREKPAPRSSPAPINGPRLALLLVGVCLLLSLGYYSCFKTRTEPSGAVPLRSGKASVEVVAVRLEPFRAATGYDTQLVAVDWKNTGNCPVRKVSANIKVFDSRGEVVYSVSDYTIYAVSSDRPGIAPGETYTKPTGQGHSLPKGAGEKAVRATVEITRVEEKGME